MRNRRRIACTSKTMRIRWVWVDCFFFFCSPGRYDTLCHRYQITLDTPAKDLRGTKNNTCDSADVRGKMGLQLRRVGLSSWLCNATQVEQSIDFVTACSKSASRARVVHCPEIQVATGGHSVNTVSHSRSWTRNMATN
jgi:hypothetical protein